MGRLITGILLVLVAQPLSAAAESTGSVCLGPNLAKVMEDPVLGPYVSLDDAPAFPAWPSEIDNQTPRVVAEELTRDKPHHVKIYFDGKLVESLTLNFTALKTNMIIIWRAPGGWRMKPSKNGRCK